MELSIGEMLMIALAIIVLFGPDKLPQIARELGMGFRRMRGAVEDIKTEILKETDNPVSEIKQEIEKVKKMAIDHADSLKNSVLTEEKTEEKISAPKDETEIKPHEDDSYEGSISR
ncbi:MAG: twin-arginine translocase TatA/TatE family subunit [Flavobacteriaceae bacterium]|jgi:sec-independent protein translocase protein TatB|nr:twin-arginine translocase TatA/TatE family subunit [Flavobacteriaceae bacterium]